MLIGAAIAAGCGAPAPPVVPPPPSPERTDAFLIDPFAGYPLDVPEALAGRLHDAWDAFRRGGPEAEAAAEAEAVLAVDPSLYPAAVLGAQAALAAREASRARDLTADAVAAQPAFTAAQWVHSLAAETLGDVVAAYRGFREIADALPQAAERATELEDRAVAITRNRFDDAMDRGWVERAAEELDRLQQWTPDDLSTAEAAWRLAREIGDTAAERAALERLVMDGPERLDTALRLAELELEVGALRSGMARLEALALRFPEDRDLAERVERAKFRWRLENLPAHVRALASAPELTRADLATWLYWLVPEVRHAPLDAPPVATDILNHERRDEIVRVLNLRLLEIDDLVHRFAPDVPASRAAALAALLRVEARAEPPPACLLDADLDRLAERTSLVCDLAARCGLLAEPGDCLPSTALSGDQALELFRLALATFAP